jgi:sugar/nucleoside kinase (ribokinase family)
VPDVIVGDVAGEIAFGQAETLVDRGTLTVGGSAAIMACGAARLGLRVAFVGVFGNDAAGRFMLEELSARGVDTSDCVVLPDRPTGLTAHLVRPGADRDRAMLTSVGCVGELTAEMMRRALKKRVRHVHVGSFYLLPKLASSLAAVFAEARKAGRTTSLDTQGDWEGRWQGGLREALGESDLYFPNRSDTIGAGDSFDAGYVYGFLQGWPVGRCLAFAAACGSLSTQAAGGVDAQPEIAEALAATADTDPGGARSSG